MATESHELPEGTLIAQRYRIVRKLGAGGMGAVYEALQVALNRKVAIKLLHATLSENPENIIRFQREAQAAASLGHPNIVSVTDFGSSEGTVFLVMEHLHGQSLSALIEREQRLSVGRTAWIATQILAALTAAHQAHIVHRDMKPDNVYLTELSGVTDVVKVLDFGIARFVENEGTSKLTATGAVLGTPAYMSPEQARGRAVDYRTDIYAVGVMIYEMLTGRLPFSATNYHALLFAILEETPLAIQALRGDVAPEFITIVGRAMARDVTQRYQSADDLRLALEPFANRLDDTALKQSTPPPKDHSQVSTGPTVAVTTPTDHRFQTNVGSPEKPSLQYPPQVSQPVLERKEAPAEPSQNKVTPGGDSPPKRQWIPWVIAASTTVVAVGLVASGRFSAGRSADQQTIVATVDVPALSVESASYDVQSPTIVLLANDVAAAPTNPLAALVDAGAPRRNAVRHATSGNSSGSVTVTEHPATPTGHRRVQPQLTGGAFPQGSRDSVRDHINSMMGSISNCANRADPVEGDNALGGWSMDYTVSLNPEGIVEHIEPYGDTTRGKPALNACMRNLLVGRQMADSPAPPRIQLYFFNNYTR